MKQLENLRDLDLEPIVIKAIDSEEGLGWSFDFACQVADEYRKFLDLALTDEAGGAIVPSSLVDDFWHLHILDTQKYADDCERFLGFFLHHFPYFGMRGEEDAENLQVAWRRTLARYESAFGYSPPSALWPKSNRCPKCGRRSPFAREHRPSFQDAGLARA